MFNDFIDRDVLLELVEKKVSFNECKKILNVSKRTLLKFRKLYGLSKDREKKTFESKCPICSKQLEYISTKEKKVYCSRRCANTRILNQETKNKISETLKSKGKITHEKKYCKNCGNDITMKRKKTTMFCCRSCASIFISNTSKGKEHLKNMVEKSLRTQTRRSKNEMLFFEFCQDKFKSVENNSPIFNGWDADIIIHDYKIAILWNGVWHYKKITKQHSVLQVQNRDRIKMNEIEKNGYDAYVIEDLGRFSKRKVKEEFRTLVKFIESKKLNSELNVGLSGLEPDTPDL